MLAALLQENESPSSSRGGVDGAVWAAVKVVPDETVRICRCQHVFTLTSFHISDVLLRQFSKDFGKYG